MISDQNSLGGRGCLLDKTSARKKCLITILVISQVYLFFQNPARKTTVGFLELARKADNIIYFSIDPTRHLINASSDINAAVSANNSSFSLSMTSSTSFAPQCALLFFGLPRNFKRIILPSIKEYILSYNKNCDVFLHSYNVTSISNPLSQENNTKLNINEVFLLTQNATLERVEDFWELRNDTVLRFRTMFPEGLGWDYPSSMDNMVKQWHSLEKVWEQKNNTYEQVGLFRSDVFYITPINISNGDAVMPRFGCGDHSNDRMFYGKRQYAKRYATERFSLVDDYIGRMKKKHGANARVQLHSETYMRDAIMYHMPVDVEEKDVCFFRARGTGLINTGDCFCDDCKVTGLINTPCNSVRGVNVSHEIRRITGLHCEGNMCPV